MPISAPPYQLKFNLDLPEEEASSTLSVEDIRIREEAARLRFESGESWERDMDGKPVMPHLFDLYLSLRIGRWPFRVAALIMWLGTPKKYRFPKTQDELANMLGMSSDRQFSVWRAQNPAIDEMVKEVWKKNAIERLPDSLEAMYTVAAREDYKGKYDRELHFKLAGILKTDTRIELESIGGNSDDILKGIPFNKLLELAGVDTPEKISEFKARIERERKEQEALLEGNAKETFTSVIEDASKLADEVKKEREDSNG
jgi:hypothetical protein